MPLLAGETILASDIPIPTITVKPLAQSVTSSTVLVNDTDMVVTLTPGLWYIQLRASVTGLSSTTLGGIRVAWTTTGTITSLQRQCFGPGFGSTDQSGTVGASSFRASAHNLSTNIAYGGIGGSTTIISEDIFLDVTATGNFQMQWAQQVSSGTATNVTSGSRLIVWPAQYA